MDRLQTGYYRVTYQFGTMERLESYVHISRVSYESIDLVEIPLTKLGEHSIFKNPGKKHTISTGLFSLLSHMEFTFITEYEWIVASLEQ